MRDSPASSHLLFAMMPGRGLSLHVAVSGPEQGPLVILLHGFPEFWYGWKSQIGPLADAGFRVLAPDQRGYNLSDKPQGIDKYTLDALADDVVALIDAVGREKARVVGHDWGGIVAWWTAIRHPTRVERLAILNAPHPEFLIGRTYLRRPSQLLKSWYVLMFQLSWLPEALLGRNGGEPLGESLRRSSRPGTFTDDNLANYRRAWSQPGALTAMINYYRAVFRLTLPVPADLRVHLPTLIVWGTDDALLNRELADESLARCDQGRLVFIDGATHWVHHEEPEQVNRLLLEFLGADVDAPTPTEEDKLNGGTNVGQPADEP